MNRGVKKTSVPFRWKLLFLFMLCAVLVAVSDQPGQEATAGFDTVTNGAVDQATHDSDRDEFEGAETPASGLGPLYNATSCVDCHQDPVTGGSSQVSEMRAGHMEHGVFMNPEGGSSLIHDRATDRQIQQRIPASEDIHAFRMSTSILGLGYVEAVDDQTLLNLAKLEVSASGGQVHGEAIQVPILEAPGVTRVGRFGWKDQHGSLLSFSADADLNEKGITSRLFPNENLYFGRSIDAFNQDTTEPNDTNGDIDKYASFMRATKAPARGAITPDVQAGEAVFHRAGCDICHTPSMQTAPVSTSLNGGMFVVPAALGGMEVLPNGRVLIAHLNLNKVSSTIKRAAPSGKPTPPSQLRYHACPTAGPW